MTAMLIAAAVSAAVPLALNIVQMVRIRRAERQKLKEMLLHMNIRIARLERDMQQMNTFNFEGSERR